MVAIVVAMVIVMGLLWRTTLGININANTRFGQQKICIKRVFRSLLVDGYWLPLYALFLKDHWMGVNE